MNDITIPEKLVFVTAVRCVATIFKDIVADHELAPKLRDNIERTWSVFSELFNRGVDIYHQALERASADIITRPKLWEIPTKAITEPSPDDDPVEINDGHYTTFMDRASCVDVMFNTLVAKHSVAELLKTEVEKVGEMLAEVYQAAGRLAYNR